MFNTVVVYDILKDYSTINTENKIE